MASNLGRQNQDAIEQRREQCFGNHEHKQAYLASVAAEHNTSTVYMTSILQQVRAVMKRRVQVIVGDKFEFFIRLA